MLYFVFVMFFLAVSAVFAAMPVPTGTVTHWFVRGVAFPMVAASHAIKLPELVDSWESSENRLKNKTAVALKRLFYVR